MGADHEVVPSVKQVHIFGRDPSAGVAVLVAALSRDRDAQKTSPASKGLTANGPSGFWIFVSGSHTLGGDERNRGDRPYLVDKLDNLADSLRKKETPWKQHLLTRWCFGAVSLVFTRSHLRQFERNFLGHFDRNAKPRR